MTLRSRRPPSVPLAAAPLAPLALLALLALAAGCGPSRSATGPAPARATASPACVVAAHTEGRVVAGDDTVAARPDTVVVAVAADEAERFVAAHVHEPLVRLDCEGRLRPALAERWWREQDGRVWAFLLRSLPADRPGGQDGAAGFVERAWAQRAGRAGGAPWPRITAVEPAGDTLRVRLDAPSDTLPVEFADPALAVAGLPPARVARAADSLAPSTWGVRLRGTGGAGPLEEYLRLLPTAPGARGPLLVVEVLRARVDPRDALDFPAVPGTLLRPADLLVTRDPAAIDYARSRRDLHVTPLPFDRVYALVTPPGAAAAVGGLDEAARRALAREVVRGGARAAEAASRPWWASAPCAPADSAPPRTPQGTPARSTPRIVHRRDDPAARLLAERLAALGGGAGAGGRLTVAALDSAAFARALAEGDAAGFVVALPRVPPAGCPAAARWPREARVEPLVEARAHAILRAGTPPVVVDGHGIVRVPARTSPPPHLPPAERS